MRPALLLSLGQVEYDRATALQQELWQLRLTDSIPDTLVLLEHPPVVTMGKSARAGNLLVTESELVRQGVALRRTERGGDVTYHGPGQLVGYPVFHVRQGIVGVRPFVERLQQGLVAALGRLGVRAGVKAGYVGVWCEERKIASIGIAVKRWVTQHGFALNVTTDLAGFQLINPCGMPGVRMTSVEIEGGETDDARVRREVVKAFGDAFVAAFQSPPEWVRTYGSHLPLSLTSLTNGLSRSASD